MRAVGVEATPAPEADEEQVAHRGGDEAGQERRYEGGAQPEPTSISRMPATSGPPNRAETAANEPAVARTDGRLRAAPRDDVHDEHATTEPRAISGASGPSTAPKARVPIAASATLGPYCHGVGVALRPFTGTWPPSPGRNRRASHTMAAPTIGRATARYQGGVSRPRASGRSVQSQSSASFTRARKAAATSAAGRPITAPMRIRRR